MNSSQIYYIITRKEVKLFVICTVTGGLFQILSRRYIKNHPEILEEPEITIKIKNPSGEIEEISNEIAKEPIIRRIIKRIRGGNLQEKLVSILLKVLYKKILKLLANKGLEVGASLGLAGAFAVIPKKAIAKVIEQSLPQHLLETEKYIMVDGEKIYLETCDKGFKFMLEVMLNNDIPYDEKKDLVKYMLRVPLDNMKIRNFLLCLIPILAILASRNTASYFLLLRDLIQAIKEGRISRKLARIIVRKLLKKGKPVDPELLDLVGLAD